MNITLPHDSCHNCYSNAFNIIQSWKNCPFYYIYLDSLSCPLLQFYTYLLIKAVGFLTLIPIYLMACVATIVVSYFLIIFYIDYCGYKGAYLLFFLSLNLLLYIDLTLGNLAELSY